MSGCFLVALASLMSPRPPSDLAKNVAPIKAMVDARFADTRDGRFGISRLGEPYDTHRSVYAPDNTVRARTELEKSLLASLRKQGIEAAAYTAPPSPPKPGGHHSWPFSGPVMMGMEYRNLNLPSAGVVSPDFSRLVEKIQSGNMQPQPYKGWTIYPRQIKATAGCVSCHEARENRKISVGDVVGVVLIALRRKADPAAPR